MAGFVKPRILLNMKRVVGWMGEVAGGKKKCEIERRTGIVLSFPAEVCLRDGASQLFSSVSLTL